MGNWKDRLGIFASVACAIHCAATPLLLAALPTLKLTEWMASPQFHQWAAAICSGIVAMAIWPAFLRYRDYRILALSTTGLGLILSAAFLLPDECCSGALPNQTGESKLVSATAAESQNHAVACESEGTCGDGDGACCSTRMSTSVPNVATDEGNPRVSASGLKPMLTTVSASHKRTASHDPAVSTGTNASHSVGGTHDHTGHDHASHDHAGHDHASHDHAGHDHSSHDHAGHDHAVSDEESNSQMAMVVAGLSPIQPWLTPIGGLLLIVAHGLNLRRRRDACIACCEPNLPSSDNAAVELARAS
jgi:hypothetical protein